MSFGSSRCSCWFCCSPCQSAWRWLAGPVPPYEINLSSISETQIVRKDVSITGTVKESGGNAVSGVEVTLNVSGANTVSDKTATTDGNGGFSFTYTETAAGDDTATVTVTEDDGEGGTANGEAIIAWA